MKKTTIRWRILKYNVAVILLLMLLTAVIFNVAVKRYFERSITGQMEMIAERTEELALLRGPEFFPPKEPLFQMGPPPDVGFLFRDVSLFYFMLDRSLREPLSVLDADYILLDTEGKRISVPQDQFLKIEPALEARLKELTLKQGTAKESVIFTLGETKYIAVSKPVSDKNTFGLGWVVLYSSLAKMDQIQGALNLILLAILIFSAGVMVLFSSHLAQMVCAPFAELDRHIRVLADRKYGRQLTLPVDEELQGLVDTVNHLSEMLEKHDQAQKTFLQNVSHEFRTPLMAIQSHAEGIRHHVVQSEPAAEIILSETQRLTRLVENLLYLSRLDALEEVYEFNPVELNGLVRECANRMRSGADQAGIVLQMKFSPEEIWITADAEKLSRAFNNLISNGIRHARTNLIIAVTAEEPGLAVFTIQDDGEGVCLDDLPRLFERFYRGRNGKFGLGLAIVKAVTDRHGGDVSVENGNPGACFRLALERWDPITNEGGVF